MPDQEIPTDRLIRVAQAADDLGLSQRYVYELIRKGKMNVVRFGRRAVRVKESEIARILREGACV